MENKFYEILLNNEKIGSTKLEKADVPMGVVFGQIIFSDKLYCYSYLKEYCLNNNIDFLDYSEDRFISTRNIPNLKVLNSDSREIKGMSCFIAGMDTDSFEITIEGIVYPFYEEEFPNHVKSYNEMNNDQQ